MMRIRMGLLLGLLLAVGVAGCGASDNGGGVASLDGSKQPTGTTPAGGRRYNRQEALHSARCMRQHGITNMPDPQMTADGTIGQELPGRMDPDDPRFKAAERACHQYGGLRPPPP